MEKKKTVKIYTPSMKPVNQRILCVEVPAEDIKTDLGIILPQQYMAAKEDESMQAKPRFIVAAAADDAVFNDDQGKPKYELAQGDEVYPFWPEDATGFKFPTVFDYELGKYFTSLHASELAGFVKNQKAK